MRVENRAPPCDILLADAAIVVSAAERSSSFVQALEKGSFLDKEERFEPNPTHKGNYISFFFSANRANQHHHLPSPLPFLSSLFPHHQQTNKQTNKHSSSA